jgi:uncharacterized membrane protein
MQLQTTPEASKTGSRFRANLFLMCLFVAGIAARLFFAWFTFLNPDEAAHYLRSNQPSLALAYRASPALHPPLLILLLHYWGLLGNSGLFLRLPSLVAGTGFCWMMFLWLQRVLDRMTALIAFALLLFSPPLIFLSAEVRQYALLLFFVAASLYFLERAIEEGSPGSILVSALSLDLALLSHYSSFIFALTIAVYAVIRLHSARSRVGVVAAWVLGQCGAMVVALFLYKRHLSLLKAAGLPRALADTWFRASIFHPGEDHLVLFILRANLRLFHYLFFQNVVGVLGLLLFLAGVGSLFRRKDCRDADKPTPRQLGLLLTLPFAINLSAAIAGIYPYGGTRHNVLLAAFAMPGVAVALASWKTSKNWPKILALVVMLAVCNLFPSPADAYIQPRNQDNRLMTQAMGFLRQSVTPGSVIFTDDQSGIMLSYYFCHHSVVQFGLNFAPFTQSRCGNVAVIAASPAIWSFDAVTFPSELRNAARTYGLDRSTPIWLFQAGWLVENEPGFRSLLRRSYGCPETKNFGQNILICELTLPYPDGAK